VTTKDSVLNLVASEREKETRRSGGAVRGIIVAVSETGEPLVDFYGNPAGASLPAISTVSISRTAAGKEAVLLFEDGDLMRPIVVGLIQAPVPVAAPEKEESIDVKLDSQRLTFTAEQEIVLRCGEASITLTRAGKVLIRGAYLSASSTGQTCVKGATVHIN